MKQHEQELIRGARFTFGQNWLRFLAGLDELQIMKAEESLKRMLGVEHLQGRTFLDIGSGSGLFSLSARRLGAKVHSLDYDPQSVACALELRGRYFPADAQWTIEEGSVLESGYMKSLGQFDVVYAWGVLHHSGDMWQALENAGSAVARGGKLFISIYNDQGVWSRLWLRIKKTYNRLPGPLKPSFACLVMAPLETRALLYSLCTLQPQRYVRLWTQYADTRGMSRWCDMVDWVGGLPFEYAKPEEVFHFYRDRGFALMKLKTCGGGHGCNEFLFEKL